MMIYAKGTDIQTGQKELNHLVPPIELRGCRDRDRMVVGFPTTCAISAYRH